MLERPWLLWEVEGYLIFLKNENISSWWLFDMTLNISHIPVTMSCEECSSELQIKKFFFSYIFSQVFLEHFVQFLLISTTYYLQKTNPTVFPPPPFPPAPSCLFSSPSLSRTISYSVEIWSPDMRWHASVSLLLAHEWANSWVNHLYRASVTWEEQKTGFENWHHHQGGFWGTRKLTLFYLLQ